MSQTIFNRIAWLQGLTVLVLLLPLFAAGIYAYDVHQRAQARIADIEPRYARLAGLVDRRVDLKAQSAQAEAHLARLAYPASQDVTQAGNDAQQRIRSLFADSKLDIISIQVLPPKEEGKFDRIPIDLRVEGDITGLQNALALLSALTPNVYIENIAIQTIGAVKPASQQRLGGQFSFSVMRARP